MIPIRDEIKSHRTPIVNYALILVNVAVFLYMLLSGPQMDSLVNTYAFFPYELTSGLDLGDARSILTSMFMHAGWMHLIGNMLYLLIFGDNVEDRLGHWGYLLFYLVGGFVAAFAHTLVNPGSQIPTVGASGAISAVLGAYLIFYPQSRVYTFVPLGFFLRLTILPASLVLILWFLLQLLSGVATIGASDMGGTAFWAHIGGFVFGVLLALIVKQRGEPVATERVWG